MMSDLARRMRRQAAKAEIRLWQRLRNRQVESTKFRRQVPIGAYIADFAAKEKHLIIEVDGGQHSIATEADEARSRELARLGYRVIRFWNGDVLKNTDGVIDAIRDAVIESND
jgi:very-short-patch-repair endonuclease